MTGDALAAYLQTVVESESARANALQAQGEALQAQYTAQQAVAVYQRAQQALAALMRARAEGIRGAGRLAVAARRDVERSAGGSAGDTVGRTLRT
jgi:hypothetical protein